jgi:hypothetical protein
VGAAGLVGALGAGNDGAAARHQVMGRLVVPMAARASTFAASGIALPPAAGGATGAAAGGQVQAVENGQPARVEETGAVTLLVPGPQIQADIGQLMTMAVANGGFVASTATQSATPGAPAQGTVTLQVPEASFDVVLAQVRAIGRVTSLTTNATDVTGQYVDLQARISALEDSRQQYLTIMAKATTIGGILAVQAQLDNLQSQLEQLQGQLQVLTSETTYATLAVTLSQKVVPPPVHKVQSGLASAWHGAVSGFVAGFEGVVRVAGPLLFALLLLAALVLTGRFAWRLRQRRAT